MVKTISRRGQEENLRVDYYHAKKRNSDMETADKSNSIVFWINIKCLI